MDMALQSVDSEVQEAFKVNFEEHLNSLALRKSLKLLTDTRGATSQEEETKTQGEVLHTTLIKHGQDYSLMQSGMHSHCFVRFESIYTPITHEDDR